MSSSFQRNSRFGTPAGRSPVSAESSTFNRSISRKTAIKQEEAAGQRGSQQRSRSKSGNSPTLVLGQGEYRLNKVIAASGRYSRREADALIEAGKVKINGQLIREMGYKLTNPNQARIEVNGEMLKTLHKVRTVAFYKPNGVITTRSDEKNRKTIFDVLPEELQGLDPAGRLDRKTSGLLILTNDGDLLHQLTHPKYHLPKIYRVQLNRTIDHAERLATQLLEGLWFEDERQWAIADEVFHLGPDEMGISIHTGMNRQVRRMFEACGYEVETLKRIAIGPYTMQGLRPGEWVELRYNDVMSLKNALASAAKQPQAAVRPAPAPNPPKAKELPLELNFSEDSYKPLPKQSFPSKRAAKAGITPPAAPRYQKEAPVVAVEEAASIDEPTLALPENFASMDALESWIMQST